MSTTSALAGAHLDAALHLDHERLNGMFDRLRATCHAGDFRELHAVWDELERGLDAHMKAEEQQLLPLFEAHDADEARRVKDEHARVRHLLAELGVQVDLHEVRSETIDGFVAFLREHAAHEEKRLYPWANEAIPHEVRHAMLARLREALR